MSEVNSYLFECEDLKIVTKDKDVYDALLDDLASGVFSERILEMYHDRVHGSMEDKILEAINGSKEDISKSIQEISNVPAVSKQEDSFMMFAQQLRMLCREFSEMKEMIEAVHVSNSLADTSLPRIKEPDDLSIENEIIEGTMFDSNSSDKTSMFNNLAEKSSGLLKGMAKQMESMTIGKSDTGKVNIARRGRGRSLKDRVK